MRLAGVTKQPFYDPSALLLEAIDLCASNQLGPITIFVDEQGVFGGGQGVDLLGRDQ